MCIRISKREADFTFPTILVKASRIFVENMGQFLRHTINIVGYIRRYLFMYIFCDLRSPEKDLHSIMQVSDNDLPSLGRCGTSCRMVAMVKMKIKLESSVSFKTKPSVLATHSMR